MGKSDGADSVGLALGVQHTPGIITITDVNTTIGYCRYDECGEIENVFVRPTHRRKGYARLMLEIVEKHLKLKLRFQPPISVLGERLVGGYERHSIGNCASPPPKTV
jgi:GNAT superfamily N-acetyltransferase